MKAELKRKLFHLTGAAYAAGFLVLPRDIYIAVLTGLLVLEAVFEWARLARPELNRWFLARAGTLVREKEHRKIAGVLWMTLGVLLTALLAEPPRVAVAAVLYLIFGDGIASLAGKSLGGPRWPSSEKRLSGSFACFAVCLAVGAVTLRPEFTWGGVIVGALAATVLERGVVPWDDNAVIPPGSAAVLLAWNGLPPYFL